MKLSIVIPVYNTEKFIRRCFDSVLKQNVHHEQIEVIVVNDGSTDDSESIINEYCNLYPNFKIISQLNAGLGAARNSGLNNAKGDYIWFVDSDDFINDGSIEKILNELNNYKPDILTIDFSCANEKGENIDWIDFEFYPRGAIGITGGEFFNNNYKWTYSCMYIIKKQLLIYNNVYFEPRINMQDAEFIPRVLFLADKVNVSDISAYVYVKRETSFINNVSPLVREKYFESVLEVHNKLTFFLSTISNDNIIRIGLIKKINTIEEILFLSYIYENFGIKSVRKRLVKLKAQEIFPFDFKINGYSKIESYRKILVFLVNISPVSFVMFFNWLRININTLFK